MQNIFSKKLVFLNKILSVVVLFTLVFSALPNTVFAEETATGTTETTEVQGCTDETALNYDAAATVEDFSCEYETTPEETATTTEETTEVQGCTDETALNYDAAATVDDDSCEFAPVIDDTASSSDDTASSTEETTNDNDGLDGEPGEQTENATTTAATSTEPTSGSGGSEGSDGGSGETGTTTPQLPEDHVSEPIPFLSDGLIGDEDSPEGEDVTGGEYERSRYDVTISTGKATAQGEVSTDANANNLRSLADDDTRRDLDFYRFNATGTNDAVVVNDVAAAAVTGENRAIAGGEATVKTGDAVAVFNIANVINTNIVNSDGYLYLANQILNENTSLNLQDFFFPGGTGSLAGASDCSLNSCLAEDIVYNFSQMNHATITNDAYLEANTGDNYVDADIANIETGDAYGAANVVNVVNTNIVDSNYRLLTFNAVGDLDGDLILPTEELFDAFFGLPNGLNQLQVGEDEDGILNVENQNDVDINNNLDTYAESGLNDVTAIDSDTVTGNSESESNILNKVNENVFGGDLMYLWIRVHGYWSGDVVGLPDGLAWEWTPDGIIIYNADAEVTPSEFLGYDIDSYTANITNHNAVSIDNNIHVDAISGGNEVDGGLLGNVRTGNTFASANVMNIANSNIIGANWTMAIVNIMGDFGGNVTFARTNLQLTGTVTSATDPAGPNTLLTYNYTIANSSDKIATDVLLKQALNGAKKGSSAFQSVAVGDLAPGESKNIELTATVDANATTATKNIVAVATVESAEGDVDPEDNVVVSEITAYFGVDPEIDTGTTTSTSTDPVDDDTGTTTDDLQPEETVNTSPTGGGCGGCGGGGNKSPDKTTTKKVERLSVDADPNAPPMLVVEKVANVEENELVRAGDPVDYTITVTNRGGQAYDATVYDTLTNEIGVVIKKDSWDLGTILSGEVIEVTYTTEYDFTTPSGKYENTAKIVAYRNDGDKENGADPLKVDEAVYTVEIKGVPLATGNIKVVAVYPAADGTVSALVTWATSKPALSQVFYGPKTANFTSNEAWLNYGFPQKSFKFSTQKTSHAMIIEDLKPGQTYAYRIDADNGQYHYVSRELSFTVPTAVPSLALNVGTSFLSMAQLLQRVAGVRTTAPTTPKPYVPPAPTPVVTPEPEPEPVATTPAPESNGIVGKVKDTLFGFFR